MTSLAHSAGAKESLLCARLTEARQITDALFALIRGEALYDRPIPERHRLIFYLGHLEAFDWNLIAEHAFAVAPLHPEFNKLFAFGIDPVDGGLPTDQPTDWPHEKEVRAYNQRVRARLDSLILRTGSTLLHVAIEHRLMHAETLAYLIHQLPLDRKFSSTQPKLPAIAPEPARSVVIPAGLATLGQVPRDESFGWDNEFDAVSLAVPEFDADVFPVTNGQFLRFVNEDGYSNRSFWSGDDWAWKEQSGLLHPLFWRRRGDAWVLRAMFGEIPLPFDWPVFVSYAEASAYACWAGKTLPTEMQWQRMAYGTPEGTENPYPWGQAVPEQRHGNFDFVHWDPVPVQAHPQGRSAFGVADLLGNGWEWTSTPFQPLPGFQPFSFYPGYSANFFDGKHYVMKGGSPRTAACMLRRSFRNWFQPHYPYVYAKFRCVED